MSLRIPRGKPITASVLRDASFLFNAPIRACIAKSRRELSFVERSRPIRKTVLATPTDGPSSCTVCKRSGRHQCSASVSASRSKPPRRPGN